MFLEISHVSKAYDGHVALSDVSLSVPQGCVYGLLGPNGAGKSTLIRIINRIISADQGTVTLEDRPMTDNDVTRLGYLPEERGLYKKMRVGDHIVYIARLKGMSKPDATAAMREWLQRFDLAEWERKRVETLSKGMQQKVQFICTVIHRPSLLIFDEPFSGFDPVNAEQLKQEILRMRDQGSTILFSTHNMESVEEVCQEISLINHSRVVLQGSVNDVRQQHKKNIIAVDCQQRIEPKEGLFEMTEAPAHRKASVPATRQWMRLAAGVTMRDAVTWLNEHYALTGFSEVLPHMQEIFIETVKQQKHE